MTEHTPSDNGTVHKLRSHSPYLTKSRFIMGLECPTKLYYQLNKQYFDTSKSDSFLQSLADGGHQIGELAKLYFAGGHEIETLDMQQALAETKDHLTKHEATLFEATVSSGNLLVRIDILRKTGNRFLLTEVKAKSVDPDNPDFTIKNGLPKSKWASYLYDIAYQKHVLQLAYPDSQIDCELMLVNKTVSSPIDGLNSYFKIVDDEKGRRSVIIDEALPPEALESEILCQLDVTSTVRTIKDSADFDGLGFAQKIQQLSNMVANGELKYSPIGAHCARCQFGYHEKSPSGLKTCWNNALGENTHDFSRPMVTTVNRFSNQKANSLIKAGRTSIDQIAREDINPMPDDKAGLSISERQWLQVEEAQSNDSSFFLDENSLKEEMDKWTYPLHFIDFESAAPAIPFNKGWRPYETVVFQYSHHTLFEDGRVEHTGQFLEASPNTDPTLNFIRALKRELETDYGTIFRFHNHENSCLAGIIKHLKRHPDVSTQEKADLIQFIKSITHSQADAAEPWKGSRDMVDLHRLVIRYFYHPAMQGSNSIKCVLPAIINASEELQAFYGNNSYGAEDGTKSLNFKNKVWCVEQDGRFLDPYKTLPTLLDEADLPDSSSLTIDQLLADGGAAMTAYAKLQYTNLSDTERKALCNGLLRYCELDTLAMVMIAQAWCWWIEETDSHLKSRTNHRKFNLHIR